ncbi:MAG: biotin transporter BioY [Fervidicoccaceae archaeon]|jgi:biotin transport system substrate-specific component
MKISPIRIPLTALSIALIALTAQIKFNLGPIPYTFQNLGITFASLMLSPLNAFVAVLIYIILIAMGLPLASGGSGGPAVLIGYTSGYIWGFAISAPLMSYLSKLYLKKRGIRLENIGKKDVIFLLIISTISFLPTYFLGYLVFLNYAIPGSKLYEWSSNVLQSIGFFSSSRYLIIFIASVLIFLPQDVFMDQLMAILLARYTEKILRDRGFDLI